MKKLLFVLCLLGTFIISMNAQAITITNLTTGVVEFYDDFENVDPASTTAAPDASGDYNAIPSVGSYQWLEWDPAIGQVTSYSDGTPAGPGAAQGDNYLRVHNISGHEFQADLDMAPSTGDHINIALMMNVPSVDSPYVVIKVRESDIGGGYQRAGARTNAGGVVGDLGGTPTSLTYLYDTWQKWEFDYVIGASTYTISVDGASSGALDNTLYGEAYAGPGNITGMGFWNGGNASTSFYMDAVPEPGTFVFLASGILALVFCAWRKRK